MRVAPRLAPRLHLQLTSRRWSDTALSMDYQDVFLESWDLVERSYEGLSDGSRASGFVPVLELVREMRRRGYDRVFRAGMAVYSLILSRSAKHGLRSEQPFVELFVPPWPHDGRMGVWCGPGQNRFVEERFAFTPALERALDDLARAPID